MKTLFASALTFTLLLLAAVFFGFVNLTNSGNYTWRQIAGPKQATIDDIHNPTIRVSDLTIPGTYEFELSVKGQIKKDSMTPAGLIVHAVVKDTVVKDSVKVFVHPGIIVPVRLINFTGLAQNDHNLLTWQTATEGNNKEFQIESSPDGIAFYKIGSVPGNINSTSILNYSFKDSNPGFITYYRLKQIDLDGQYTNSNTIKVERPVKNNVSIVNPVQQQLKLSVTSLSNAKCTALIFDMHGRTVYTNYTIDVRKGTNHYDLDVHSLVPGVYVLYIKLGNESFRKKFIK